jgi:hypothetical protein
MLTGIQEFRLGPDPERLRLFGRIGPRLTRRRRRAGAPATQADMLRFLHLVAEGVGFDAACVSAGLNRGDVLLARARSVQLAALWDQVGEARRAAMEAMWLDRGEAALRAPPLDPSDGGFGLDKPTAGLLQWTLGAPRVARAGRPEPKPAAARAAEGAAARPALPPELSDDETEAMFAGMMVRLTAAEAALEGVPDGPADTPDGA